MWASMARYHATLAVLALYRSETKVPRRGSGCTFLPRQSSSTPHQTLESARIIPNFLLPLSTADLTALPVKSLFWLISFGLLYWSPPFALLL